MTEGQVAPVDSQERLLAGLLGIGALISLASLAFAWASNGSLFTGYSWLADAGLNGSSFGAFDAEGGSWFAYTMLGAVMQIATVLLVLRPPAARI